jgi:predicted glutamine amidotransferase
MSRLFAYVCNDPDRVRCALYGVRESLTVTDETSQGFDGWGIGFLQGDEVLLRRRPRPVSKTVDFFEMVRDLRTNTIVGHVRQGTVGAPKNENTHPFRFRKWLFAHHGTIPHFEELQRDLGALIPDFLRKNIRGQTDSEQLFHLLLGQLHAINRLDDDFLLRNEHVATALCRTFSLLDDFVRRRGMDPRTMECTLAFTNGNVLLAARRGQPVFFRQTESLVDCPICRESVNRFGREPRRIDHEHLRSVLVLADCPPPGPAFIELLDNHFLSVDRDLKMSQAELS